MSEKPMAKIGSSIEGVVGDLGRESGKSPYANRVLRVQREFKEVITNIYKDNATLFLKHVNAVFITEKNSQRVLIVYIDESIFAAELNAQREMVKLMLLEMHGEQLDSFEIYTSRSAYKDRHPYKEDTAGGSVSSNKEKPLPTLDEEDVEKVESTAARIDDERLRIAMKKAMTADLQRQKAES